MSYAPTKMEATGIEYNTIQLDVVGIILQKSKETLVIIETFSFLSQRLRALSQSSPSSAP
jgi:hypothetical protein